MCYLIVDLGYIEEVAGVLYVIASKLWLGTMTLFRIDDVMHQSFHAIP